MTIIDTGRHKSADDKCYLCDIFAHDTPEGKLTRDHIPPKGLFPNPRPPNLITVPCCYACNQAFHTQDEKLRLFVSAGCNRDLTGDHIWKQKVIPNTIKPGRQRGLVKKMISSAMLVRSPSKHGKPDKVYVQIPREEIQGALIRTVKGLLYTYYPTVQRNDLTYKLYPIGQFTSISEIESRSGPLKCRGEIGDGVFQYWGDVIPSEPTAGLWIIRFYKYAAFGVMHKSAGPI